MIDKIIQLLEKLNLPSNITSIIILILLLLSILGTIGKFIWQFLKYLAFIINKRRLNRELDTAYYSKRDVDEATRFYIPTKYQNVSPSEDEEPGRMYIATAKNKLIPLLIKEAFTRSGDDNKFYLILADSGMGKTTFMINLYLAYRNKIQWLFSKPKFSIRLFPLGAEDVLDKVKEIGDKHNVILLLDALDEDIEAVKDYKKRIRNIIDVAKDFKCLVLTCRTQFFPTEHEEPHRTGYFTYGTSNKEYKFQKLYLSVFSNKDVKKYLRKRYPLLNPFVWRKYSKAKSIVEKSPNLVVRPMLLSYIGELIKSDREFKFTFEIYEELIRLWLIRESEKVDIIKKYGSSLKYRELLYDFSLKLSVDLYENSEARGGYFVDIMAAREINSQLSLIEYDSISLSDWEVKSKSLLNRTADGRYKFSHKSFLEVFLAINLFNNLIPVKEFRFEGLNMTKYFLINMVDKALSKADYIKICTSHSARLRFMDGALYKIPDPKKIQQKAFIFSRINELRKINEADILIFLELPSFISSVLIAIPGCQIVYLLPKNIGFDEVKYNNSYKLLICFYKLFTISSGLSIGLRDDIAMILQGFINIKCANLNVLIKCVQLELSGKYVTKVTFDEKRVFTRIRELLRSGIVNDEVYFSFESYYGGHFNTQLDIMTNEVQDIYSNDFDSFMILDGYLTKMESIQDRYPNIQFYF